LQSLIFRPQRVIVTKLRTGIVRYVAFAVVSLGMNQAVTDELLTTAGAAVILGVSTRTVERLRRAGELPCLTVGHGPKPRVYYSRAVLHAYMNRRTGQAAS
jgi:excisionase family DNA binding protein